MMRNRPARSGFITASLFPPLGRGRAAGPAVGTGWRLPITWVLRSFEVPGRNRRVVWLGPQARTPWRLRTLFAISPSSTTADRSSAAYPTAGP